MSVWLTQQKYPNDISTNRYSKCFDSLFFQHQSCDLWWAQTCKMLVFIFRERKNDRTYKTAEFFFEKMEFLERAQKMRFDDI